MGSASSLEDNYTEGLSGDVVARTGNVLYLQGATLFLNTANVFYYQPTLSRVVVGPATIVTADDNTTLTGLNAASISVGQHISARGTYSVLVNRHRADRCIRQLGRPTTGSVRLQPTAWGPLVSSSAGGVIMNLQTINDWPISDYVFTGNGAAAEDPTKFSVTTPGLTLPVSAPAPAVGHRLCDGTGRRRRISPRWTSTPGRRRRPRCTRAERRRHHLAFGGLAASGFRVNARSTPGERGAAARASVNPAHHAAGAPDRHDADAGQHPRPTIYSPHYAFTTVATVSSVNIGQVSVFAAFQVGLAAGINGVEPATMEARGFTTAPATP